MAELILIRHAPALTQGLVTGRRDVPAMLPSDSALATARAAIGSVAQVMASPALRCMQTAAALFAQPAITDPRLWEQSFGIWEGATPETVPDLGPMHRSALAIHRPPEGESFADLCARTHPALCFADGPVALVVHAGTVRAALALALADIPAALAFEIAPFSQTRLRCTDGQWAILSVNHPL